MSELTRAQHLAEAEKLLQAVEPREVARRGVPGDVDRYIDRCIAQAQAHALIAIAKGQPNTRTFVPHKPRGSKS